MSTYTSRTSSSGGRYHPCTIDLLDNTTQIIDAFSKNPRSATSTYAWARKAIQKKTTESIKILTANDDWHFNAEHAVAADLEDFKIEQMAAEMKALAPDLCLCSNSCLCGTARIPNASKEAKDKRHETILTIKTAVIISIMMQSRNSKCNVLESVFGIFLHSTNTPEKVIQALAHMGISISQTAIHRAIHSLSAETTDTLREMGQTLLAADPLTHLTSGALIRLEHGVVPADLESPTANLDMLHPETDHPSGLTRRERWNAWKFKSDLYEHTRSMDNNQSTHAGNISAIENLLFQGGSARVLLRRSIESTPWLRYQFVVFVMGFFHLKMAAADALWRIFIEPKQGRQDDNSLMAYVTQSRPRETGKIGSNPGFRRMHDLDVFGKVCECEPSQDLINEMADHLAEYYVAGGEVDIYATRSKSASLRDEQHENILMLHQYLLLYEETSFAMNRGDIGRLETTFPPWISIFPAVAKHKYSAHMTKYLTDVHFVYPPRLG
ncbi:hypothetical protein B0H13DRAFT_2244977 [Mycena leptocephala]|nr:hypothetical protein B0H13DRAFT_2244977 [Mycena leptocephala]